MKKENTYTRKELDTIIKKHIEENAEILEKNLKRKNSQEIKYV